MPVSSKFLFDGPVFVQKTCVRETLFCVFPSTSGRVVSHQVRRICPHRVFMVFMDAKHTQRDDKVALFRMLREDLERIKAGTLDTNSMQLVRLSGDNKAEVIE